MRVASRAGRKLTCIFRVWNLPEAKSNKLLCNSQVCCYWCTICPPGTDTSNPPSETGWQPRYSSAINQWQYTLWESAIEPQQLHHQRDVSFSKHTGGGYELRHSIQGTKATPLNHKLRRSRSRTEQHLRSLVSKYMNMWNFLWKETVLTSL